MSVDINYTKNFKKIQFHDWKKKPLSKIDFFQSDSFPLCVQDIDIFFDSFLIDKKARDLSPGTISYYQEKIVPFLSFLKSHGVNNLEDISPHLIRKFLIELKETGHNAGGVHAYYRAIKAFINWCEIEYEPEKWKNPFLKIKPPKVPLILLDPVNIDHVKAMIKTCNKQDFYDARDSVILIFLLDTGVRAAELLAIKTDDIDFNEKSVQIVKGKGNKSRIVFFSEKSKNAITKYLDLRVQYSEYLWTSAVGKVLTYGGLRSIIRRRSRAANVPIPSLHSFRRFFALQMNRNGADLVSIQKLMGHSDINVLRRYLNQTQEDLKNSHTTFGPLTNVPLN
jgi:integrase/recombinase XerD